MRPLTRLILSVAVLAASAAPALAQSKGDDRTKFTDRENALWSSVANKRMDAIKSAFSDDYIATYDSGIIGRDDELKGIAKGNIKNVRLDDVQVHRLDPSNVIVTSKAVVDGDMEGKSISGTYNTMTVWHRSGNRWNVAAHTEVKAQ